VLLALWGAALPARAADQDEIAVYDDGINKPGEYGLEVHLNTTPQGIKERTYPKEYLTDGGVRMTVETSYGFTKTLEGGLYLPELAIDKYGNPILAGAKLRLKWLPIQPDEKTGGFFAGANVELATLNHFIQQSRENAELRLISGYHAPDEWLIAFNPIFDWGLSDGFASPAPDFNFALKATHRIVKGLDLGVEYYSDIGRIDQPYGWGQQDNRIYAVADVDMKPFVFNFGVGYGLTEGADRWTVKTIIEVPLD